MALPLPMSTLLSMVEVFCQVSEKHVLSHVVLSVWLDIWEFACVKMTIDFAIIY